MRNVAIKKNDADLAMEVAGIVEAVEGSAFTVFADGSKRSARRAASCLLEPALGDRVLLALIGDGSAYVLAILERKGTETATLSVDGDCNLHLPNGKLQVTTAEGVGFVSAGEISMVSPSLAIKAAEAAIGVGRLVMAGKELMADIAQVKTKMGALDIVAERIRQKAERVYRFVEELDQLKAKRVDYTAEKSMHLHGDNALMTADLLVKIDGEHIHMG